MVEQKRSKNLGLCVCAKMRGVYRVWLAVNVLDRFEVIRCISHFSGFRHPGISKKAGRKNETDQNLDLGG